jgi:hypothetical protein
MDESKITGAATEPRHGALRSGMDAWTFLTTWVIICLGLAPLVWADIGTS